MLNLKYKSYTNGHESLPYLRRQLVLLYHLHSINIYQCPLYNTDSIASIPMGHRDAVTCDLFTHTYIALSTAFWRL